MSNTPKIQKETTQDTDTSPNPQVIALTFSMLSMIGILLIVPFIYMAAALSLVGDVRPSNTQPEKITSVAKLILYTLSIIYTIGIIAYARSAYHQAVQKATQRSRDWLRLKIFSITSIATLLLLILVRVIQYGPGALTAFVPASLTGTDLLLLLAYLLVLFSSVFLVLFNFLHKK